MDLPKKKSKLKITVKKKLKNNSKELSQQKIIMTSDEKSKEIKKNYNNDFIEILSELKNNQILLGDQFRSKAYSKAEFELIKYNKPIYSVDQIKHLPNIGKTIIEKLNEFVKTGKVNAIEKEKNNPILLFSKVYGIGPKKAKELINKGITSIQQLKENEELLNDKQKIGLKYYEDIIQRIPRSEIELYKKMLESNFKESAPPDSTFEIVGSYRRGNETSGDIDIIITNKNNNN